MKLKAAFLVAFVFICSIAMAEMTIFFKDGTSIGVTKIVFRENVADLFLLNGTIRTVSAEKIDLKASGIPKAEGSYGQSGISAGDRHKRTATPPLIGDAKQRQAALQEEWDKAEQSAVALKTIGAIRQGDVVRILNRSASGSATPTTSYGYFEAEEGSFEDGKFVQGEDEPYLVIYKAADGTFGKKLFDSATFHSNFSINEKSTGPPEPPPVFIPDKQIETKTPSTEVPVKTDPLPSIEPTIKEEPIIEDKEEADKRISSGSFPSAAVLIGLGGIALAAGALFLYSRKHKKPFINTLRFRQYESELRDFELEIWLKHGRTMDQLVEICLKKFYQEQPAAVAAAIKISKGSDRLSIVQALARQSGLDTKTAEDVYLEMHNRINWIRETVRQVAEKIDKQPLVTSDVPTAIISTPSAIAAALQVVASKPTISERPKTSVQPEPAPKSTQIPPAGLPLYLRNVLKQLGELSD